MVELFAHYGESKLDIESLVSSVNKFHYCTNKIRFAKRWAKGQRKLASSSEEGFLSDETYDAVIYVEAMCIANEYTMGHVYPALRDNGPLDVEVLEELQANYTRDYAKKHGSDAMYAFTWFMIDYMRLLNYTEDALTQTNKALTLVRQQFSPNSLAETDLLRAYRILTWQRLYATFPPTATETEIFIFNQTMQHIVDYWKAEDTADLMAEKAIHE
ncbi:unnamed protein product, partial [Mesorhabditis belari]|uniref:Uncharacterized protein n=1 Tax=Mesorhabditis belari TaxID=2138241 RepID=A0AAF3ELT9_9BILA